MIAPVVCIDGPVASGKGTVAALVAQRLAWHYLDSGALYRLCALAARNRGVDLSKEAEVAQVARSMRIRFADAQIWLEGVAVTDTIREEIIGEGASLVGALPLVRVALLQVQRDFRQAPGLVADGRDMGTVVFPEAELKVFLTASAHSRAMRRTKQLIEKGFSANFDDLFAELLRRDERDTNRAVAPLRPAEGAILLDSTELSIDQTVQAILDCM